jgi:hypothetical protein
MRSFLFATSLIVLPALLVTAACDSSPETGEGVVVPYVGSRLTAEDAVFTDGFGIDRTWNAERDGDLVILTRSQLCGDECNATTELTLCHQGEGTLPAFVSLERIRQEFLPDRREERRLEAEQIQVQDWSVSGVVSGHVEGEVRFVFWYDCILVRLLQQTGTVTNHCRGRPVAVAFRRDTAPEPVRSPVKCAL